MVLPRYHERDAVVAVACSSPLTENIHAVGEVLSRSCNIRLLPYLPHFRAFHFAPPPLPLLLLPRLPFSRPPSLFYPQQHILLRQPPRTETNLEQSNAACAPLPIYILGRRERFTAATIPQLDVFLKCGELFVFPVGRI